MDMPVGWRLHLISLAWVGLVSVLAAGCGSRSGLLQDENTPAEDAGGVPDASEDVATTCRADGVPCQDGSQCCGKVCRVFRCASEAEFCKRGEPARLLASGLPTQPRGIANDATRVYWSQKGTISSVSKTGGAIQVEAEGQGWVQRIAADSTAVYWASSAGVFERRAGQPIVKLGGGELPWALAIDRDSVFWGTFQSERLQRAVRGGGTPAQEVAEDKIFAHAIAVDATHVYGTLNHASTLGRVPKSGGPWERLTAQDITSPWGIALVDDSIYFTVACGPNCGSVGRISKSGGQATMLVSNLSSPLGLTTDGEALFWATFDTKQTSGIFRMDLATNDVVTLADGFSSLDYLSVDSSCVYWVDNAGRVWAIAKRVAPAP